MTGPTPHDRFQHYRDLTLDRLWMLNTSPGERCAPRRSALPSNRCERPRLPTSPPSSVSDLDERWPEDKSRAVEERTVTGRPKVPAKYLVLNVRPGSLFDAVVPPGFGFAVIAPDGRVLFHSQENLSLGENFFEEVGESAPRPCESAVGPQSHMDRRLSRPAASHSHRTARRHRRMPVAHGDIPRADVRSTAGVFTHQSGTFRLGLVNLCCLFFSPWRCGCGHGSNVATCAIC